MVPVGSMRVGEEQLMTEGEEEPVTKMVGEGAQTTFSLMSRSPVGFDESCSAPFAQS